MKIKIDNREYSVTHLVCTQLLSFIEQKMLEIYNTAPNFVQAAFMVIVRHELSSLEKKHPDKKDILRPPKRKDPVEHVLGLVKGALLEVSKEQVIEAKTNADNEIITLELGENTSQVGRPLVAGWDEW